MDFISREAWGAQYAAGAGARDLPCSEAWLHHTATKTLRANATVEQEREQMRAVEKIGQQRFGQGFSYNLAIFPSGRVYVGCGVRRIGAHTARRNSKALGVVLVGNYQTSLVTMSMQDALVELLRFAAAEKWLRAPRFAGGHRDVPGGTPTACPGGNAWRLIPTINSRAAGPAPAPARPAPAAPAPAPAAPTLTTGGPSMLVVHAPDDARQFLCDKDTATHISPNEKAVLNAAGVPYVGESDASDDARREFLRKRGVEL